jgi:L-alanine-DL-glutamate epimerase-like enolase superfamily enzyme
MTNSTITRIEAATIRVPLDRVTSFSNRTVTARDYAVVRITTKDGGQGIGFCYAGSSAGGLVTKAVRELCGPLLLGESSYHVERHWARMYQESILHGRAGSTMRAISILDTAMWDRNARAANVSLADYLGRAHGDTVPAYASGGYYLDGKTPEKLGEELAGYVAMGYKAVKMKVGRLSVAEERRRIETARAAIGPDVILMLDANNAWADLPTAMRYMEAYQPSDPYWIEEPFLPDDMDNHRRLAERIPFAVATGEIEVGRWRFLDLIKQEAASILQTDAAVCGGVTEFRRIAQTAASHGIMLAPHWFHDLHVHLVAAHPNARWVEVFTDDQVLNFRRLINQQLELSHGELVIPNRPGLGFDFDEQAVNRYALDPWEKVS